MKKTLSILLAVVLCFGLAACGPQTPTDKPVVTTAPPVSTTAPQQTTEKPDDKPPARELTVWHIYGEGDAMHDTTMAVIKAAEEEFGIKINAVSEETEAYKVKCNAAASGGTLPDIFLTWGRSVIGQFIDAGVLVNLSDYMSDDIAENVTDGSFAEFSKDGNVYGFTDANSVGALFCNTALFKKYNIDVIPTTWEELGGVCQAFLDNGVTPFCVGATDAWTLAMYYDIIAVRCVGAEKVANTFLTNDFSDPGYLEAAQLLAQAVELGCFRDDAIALNRTEAEADFYGGLIPMMMQGSWTAARVYANAENPDDFTAVPFPVIHEDIAGHYSLTGGGQTAFCVSAKTADPAFTTKVAEFIAQRLADGKFAMGGGISPYKSTPNETSNALFYKTFEMSTKAESMTIWFDTV